jgi:hypothetical protein
MAARTQLQLTMYLAAIQYLQSQNGEPFKDTWIGLKTYARSTRCASCGVSVTCLVTQVSRVMISFDRLGSVHNDLCSEPRFIEGKLSHTRY